MKKFLLSLIVLCLTSASTLAAKLPDDVQSMLKKTFPAADIRFDGVIILQDGTVYLPLFPAKIKTPETFAIQTTYPAKTPLQKCPDVVVFNNDFVLLKVIVNQNGTKTIKKFDKPPVEVKSGLLPQDMLVPKNLIIPENLKGITGNLDIKIAPAEEIKVAATKINYDKVVTVNNIKPANLVSTIPQLKDKTLYISTCYTKNIQVVKGESKTPAYALSQKSIPNCIAITPDNKFLFVTAYNSTLVDVISLADDRIIKQLDLTTNGGEIVMDSKRNVAYVSSPDANTIYQVALSDMTLKKKIKVNGRCERMILNDDYLIYVDRFTNKIWSIELGNEYTLKDLGSYPNISKLAYENGNLYLASRTKNRIAVLDYKNQTLLSEFETVKKPVDMVVYGKFLYVLGAEDNVVQVIDRTTDEPVANILLNTNGFPTSMTMIPNTSLVLISDAKAGKYSVLDLNKKMVIKTNPLDMPASHIIVGKNIRKI